MGEPERSITEYLRAALVLDQLTPVDFSEDTGAFLALDGEELESGCLADEKTARLFEVARRSGVHGTKAPIPIVISLLSLRETDQRSRKPVWRGLIMLPAQLRSDGTLAFDLSQDEAWAPCERLSSAGTEEREVMIAPLERFWSVRRSLAPERSLANDSQEWGDYLAYGRKFLHLLTAPSPGEEPLDRQAEEAQATLEEQAFFVRPLERINANAPIIAAYDRILSGKRDAAHPLFDRMVSPASPTSQGTVNADQVDAGARQLENALASLGTMSARFPLARSQRVAAHAGATLAEGEVLAVSGPPGTGKTTLLQSIVATALVGRALEGGPAPVVVCTSTNNQAVTNVIDSFGSVAPNDHGLLDARWLPQAGNGHEEPLAGIAAYCPSRAKVQEARERGYLVEQTNRSGVYAEYSEADYVEAARAFALSRASEYLGIGVSSPRQAARLLRERLERVDQARRSVLAAGWECAGRGGRDPEALRGLGDALSQAEGLLSHEPYAGSQRVEGAFRDTLPGQSPDWFRSLDEALDTTLRYVAFWLAVHYYEFRWLMACAAPGDEGIIPEEDRFKNTPAVRDRYWSQAASLTPCFVMTLYQAPRYFTLREGGTDRNDYGRIDLLIVDEAGQVNTPVALPAFAFARRAVVVGDVHQLAPIWSFDPCEDQGVAQDHGIAPTEWDALAEAGLTCSQPSSLMRAAAHACAWRHSPREAGLFLEEHYRCVRGIIEFCNELVYDGKLVPSRTEGPDDPGRRLSERPFLFRLVPGSEDRRAGSSRNNSAEASSIAEWVARQRATLEEVYKKPVEKVVGVVTPFSAQARLIRRRLRELDKGLAGITVGTAHSLQGAELPVVLFSATYGERAADASFINANPELMNVAVSRAKDLFIVFGAQARRSDTGAVMSVVNRFALEGPCDFAGASQTEAAPQAEAPAVTGQGPAPTAEPDARPPVAEQQDPAPGAQEASPVALSKVLAALSEQGLVRGRISTAQVNALLGEAGLIERRTWEETGKENWFVTELGARLGITQREVHGESPYTYPVYDERSALVVLGVLLGRSDARR